MKKSLMINITCFSMCFLIIIIFGLNILAETKIISEKDINDFSGEVELSEWEFKYLQEKCPDVVMKINSGYIIVYGEIIKPPFLIFSSPTAVFINGIRIYPKKDNLEKELCRRKFNMIHEWSFNLIKRKNDNYQTELRNKLNRLKKDNKILDYSLSKKNNKNFIIINFSDNIENSCPIKLLPRNSFFKYNFLISCILAEYRYKRDNSSKQEALDWLEIQFDLLQHKNIVQRYTLSRSREVIRVKLKNHGSGSYKFKKAETFQEIITPGHLRYLKKKKITEDKKNKIIEMLNSNKIIIYSYSFEKKIDYDKKLFAEFESIKKNKDKIKLSSNTRKILSISNEEEKSLIKELKFHN